MILLAAIEERGGMLFAKRRVSQDKALRERMLHLAGEKPLRMHPFSAGQFRENADRILSSEDFLEKAGEGDFCFLENCSAAVFTDKIEKLILYRWNRRYPADFFFDLPFTQWKLTETAEFSGNSHEKITEEVYIP